MIAEVYAQDTPKENTPRPPGLMDMILPLGLMFFVFYFLIMRPNQKKMKKREEFIRNIKKGDSVVTNGGLLGRVVGVTDNFVTLDVSENVKVKVLRSHIGFSSEEVKQQKPKEKE